MLGEGTEIILEGRQGNRGYTGGKEREKKKILEHKRDWLVGEGTEGHWRAGEGTEEVLQGRRGNRTNNGNKRRLDVRRGNR